MNVCSECGRPADEHTDLAIERCKVKALTGEVRRLQGRGGLSDDQLVVACKNIGYDLTCGACAAVFYTGTGIATDQHTCSGERRGEPQRIVTQKGVVCDVDDAVQAKPLDLSGPRCDCCGTEGETVVACSSMGAVSFAYCRTCAEAGVEPYGMCVSLLADCGASIENVAEWAHPIVFASLLRAGKTAEDLYRDAKKADEEYEAYCNRVGGAV